MGDVAKFLAIETAHSAAKDCWRPGEERRPEHFDIAVGPQAQRTVLGEEISTCLLERGFCTLRIQEVGDCAEACEDIRHADVSEQLGRLPIETEEGYLGRAGSAKVMWLETDDAPPSLKRGESTLSTIAEILQPFTENALGCPITERTPTLVCSSLLAGDEMHYDNPSASNQELQDYYSTWARGVLRAVLFMSSAGRVLLSLKEAAVVTSADASYDVWPSAGTLLLLREDTFEYSFVTDDDNDASCWLQSTFLKPGPQFALDGDLEGDVSLLQTIGDGPPPPNDPKALVAVVSLGIQSALKISDHHQEWAAYTAGTDGQLEMPFSRFDYQPYYSEEVDNPLGTTYVKHFSVQEGIDLFDNRVFEISNAESEALDPMFRQVMEVGYVAVHQLGITKKYCNTNPIHASVSVGCDKQEWLQMPVTRSVATNNQLAICANRFNYVFNLKGGSYVCDTACSSTLVAVHLGKTNLLEQRWDPLEFHLGMGTSLTLTVGSFIGGCASHMLSPGGRCFTFNATANGYNRGDGTSGMVLKVGENDDHRMAYLRGSQMGQDGRSASMSAPNGPAQEKCCWGAIREARMTPPESTVWDCHGTGTSLGDPIEVGAVRKVQIKTKRLEPLMIASSKSNFGHLEGSAAGIAMNKCVMVVVMTICAPTSHLKTLNPHLDHTSFNAIFCTESNPYKYKQGHCQVSSFGVGGTNGHAIFWGKKANEAQVSFAKLFLKKLMASPPPIVQDGSNPADWDFSGLSFDSMPGDRYKVVLSKDTLTGEEKFNYERLEDVTEPVDFYCITGSHNNWTEDRMMEGDVPFLFHQEVSVPDEGLIEFRLLADGDQERVIAPVETTSKCTAPVLGPRKDLSTCWHAKGDAGSTLRIELLAPPKGACSVLWVRVNEADG
uniref:Type I polyketide synthase n=1 Tax=Gambierdiscus polynesiensis TaxID=439318 RepID=A0A1S6K845_9DINO|nr:type I polyketide synthase [Gambierdiscus polynesiensis]